MIWRNLQKDFVGWLGIILITVSLISVQSHPSWLVEFPKKFFVPFDLFLTIMDLMITSGWFFMGVSWLEWPIWRARVASIIAMGCYKFVFGQ